MGFKSSLKYISVTFLDMIKINTSTVLNASVKQVGISKSSIVGNVAEFSSAFNMSEVGFKPTPPGESAT